MLCDLRVTPTLTRSSPYTPFDIANRVLPSRAPEDHRGSECSCPIWEHRIIIIVYREGVADHARAR